MAISGYVDAFFGYLLESIEDAKGVAGMVSEQVVCGRRRRFMIGQTSICL